MLKNKLRIDDSLRGTGVTAADWNQNGFITRTTSLLTWDDATRTLSLMPTSGSFKYLIAGEKYSSTGDTRQVDDIEGIHAVYYDGATLTSLANPTSGEFQMLILTKALVSILYWDKVNAEGIYIGEERHGKGMSPSMHNYLHHLNGLIYLSGLGLNTMSVDGTGTVADAQLGVDEGSVADEDIHISPAAVLSTVGLPIYHMEGALSWWRRTVVPGFPMRTFDNTNATRLCFNEYTGGIWQLTEVVSGRYVLGHIFGTTEKDKPIIMIMGQNQYLSKRDAQTGANTEILSIKTNDLLFPEIRPLFTVILQTNLSYANDLNAIIVSTDTGDNFVDHRSSTISRVSISTDDHNALVNLLLAQTGVSYGHIDDQAQVIAGTKTFSAGVIFPSVAGVSGSWWDNAGTLTKVP